MTILIVVPTQRELDVIRPLFPTNSESRSCSFQLCGFGPIAAAARTGALLSRYQPERAILIGVAGTYNDCLDIGSAHRFDSVVCDGVGVGSGADFQCAGQLGWFQFTGDAAEPRVGDRITLDSSYVQGYPSSGLAVTCCAASANREEAAWRAGRFPTAVAEEMEGFGVALACSLARTPLQIVRGISNRVGDRDHANWKIDQALRSAANLASELIDQTWMPSP